MYSSEALLNQKRVDGLVVTDYTDVHDRFMTWFAWGFWSTILITCFSLLMCLSVIPKLAFCAMTSQFCLIYAYCNAGVWWISGLVWRLQRSG